jgi:Cellulose binding domain
MNTTNAHEYTLENASYNAVIEPGQSVTIGFDASPGKPASWPTNYVLNGVPIALSTASAT